MAKRGFACARRKSVPPRKPGRCSCALLDDAHFYEIRCNMSSGKAGVGAVGSTTFSIELHRERLDDRRAERDIRDRRERPMVARREHARPQRTDPAGRRGAVVSTPKKSCGVVEPTGRSNVAPKVGGIPVMPGVRALVCGGRKIARPRTQGAAMTRFLNELLLFSCLALFVTGVVLAAARLLI